MQYLNILFLIQQGPILFFVTNGVEQTICTMVTQKVVKYFMAVQLTFNHAGPKVKL